MKILSYRNSINNNRKWALFAAYGCLILFVIFFLFPPYYMLVTSLKTNKEIAELSSNPWLIKQGLTFEHYKYLFTETPFLTFFKNTIIGITSLFLLIILLNNLLS